MNDDPLEQFTTAATTPYQPPDLPNISMIKLIASSTNYDGKVVRVEGFLELEFESTILYLHREDYEQMIDRNGLWVEVSDAIWGRKYELTERYVSVTGTFRANFRGHMDACSGAITSIQDVRPKAKREEIEAIVQAAREKAEGGNSPK